MSDTDISNDFLSGYRKAKSESLNEPCVIKPSSSFRGVQDSIILYTDGSAKGSDKAIDNASFAGWGVYMKHSKEGHFRELQKFGNLFNSSSFASELRAVLEGLKFVAVPADFELVTDCADVIEGFHTLDSRMKTYDRDIKRYDPINYPLLKLWKQIYDVILSAKVNSLTVRWVRSHSLERFGDNLPDPSLFSDPEARSLYEHCVGNEQADRLAVLGAIKSVRGALFNFNTPMEDQRKLLRSIETVRKNFSNSRFAREEAVRYLSQHDDDFLPKDILKQVLDEKTLARIELAKARIISGDDPDDTFKGLLCTKHVISSTDPINKQMFMSRCRSNDESKLSMG